MPHTNFKIRDLFKEDANLTFLVGAGCSVDPPSCLPSGRAMMNTIIEYTCAESEIESIKALKELRFEQLIEIIRDRLDPELKVIDFYGLCDRPNLQHFFLAERMKQGQFVLTTNFDFLIEYALQQSGITKEQIKVVITKEDFENFSNPQELYSNGLKALYKIHGSIKNIINGQVTRDSLIATIQAFGTNKEGENIFQLEQFKQPLFTNITNKRSLVVMGYSGSDDFDIVPTLKVLNNLKSIIWINYMGSNTSIPKINEIEVIENQKIDKLNKVDQILFEIKKLNKEIDVYRVDVNTSLFIKEFLNFNYNLDHRDFSVIPIDWLRNNIKKPTETIKYSISYKIYHDSNLYDDALRCAEKVLSVAQKTGDNVSKAAALTYIGDIYFIQNEYSKAVNKFIEALKIVEKERNLPLLMSIMNNIGMINQKEREYVNAIEFYQKALEIAEKLGNKASATYNNNIGNTYHNQKNYEKALEYYQKALKINEQSGNLSGKATCYNNIGSVYDDLGKFGDALNKYEVAYNIREELHDYSGKANCLNNIGLIYTKQGKIDEALKNYNAALNIYKLLSDHSGKAKSIYNIGCVYDDLGTFDKALGLYHEALQIFRQINDIQAQSKTHIKIGTIYNNQENYNEALKFFLEALQILEQLGEQSIKAVALNNIGMIYYSKRKYIEALKYIEDALKINEQLGIFSEEVTCLVNIGTIHYDQGKSLEALGYFEEAYKILVKNGLGNSALAIGLKQSIDYQRARL